MEQKNVDAGATPGSLRSQSTGGEIAHILWRLRRLYAMSREVSDRGVHSPNLEITIYESGEENMRLWLFLDDTAKPFDGKTPDAAMDGAETYLKSRGVEPIIWDRPTLARTLGIEAA